MKNKLKNILKRFGLLDRFIRRMYGILMQFRFVYPYLKLDHIKICRNNPDDNERYLVYKYEGHVGLMTMILSVLGWLKYADKHGMRLVVDMASGRNIYRRKDGENVWEIYFKQPQSTPPDLSLDDIYSKCNYALCPRVTRQTTMYDGRFNLARVFAKTLITFPLPRDYKNAQELHDVYCRLYAKYIRFDDSVAEYVRKEQDELLKNKGVVLGVLIRGTDYTQGKPYMHPVQPSPEQVIEEAVRLRETCHWDYIYLATDEYAVEKLFRNTFPDKCIVNKRAYYDQFDFRNKYLIDVKLERDNDEYLRGLEYLSSMNLLSKCDMLIGGMCGGSQMALIMNNNQYKYVHLFDLGNYGESGK